MNNLEITPKLVHKDSVEDVLLSHPRPALPLQIEKSTADKWVQAGLGCLLALYQSHEQNNTLLYLNLQNSNQGLTNFLGTTIPTDPAWEPYRALPYQIIESEFSASHADVLQQFESLYAKASTADYPIAELFRSTSYKMLNQADHYFFYRKDHEHVPGTMMIEAQRQAVYAHIYTMTQHVRGDVTISLDSMNCKFYGYVDLMYPLELVVDDLQENRNARSKKTTYRVAFFQRSRLVAVIDSGVNIINMNQFKRLRNLFMYEENDHRYAPIDANKVRCTLVDMQNKEYAAECVSISRHGCMTTYDNVMINDIRSVKVDINGLTFSSSIEFEKKFQETIVWRFPHLNQIQLINMGEIIKRAFIFQNNEVYP